MSGMHFWLTGFEFGVLEYGEVWCGFLIREHAILVLGCARWRMVFDIYLTSLFLCVMKGTGSCHSVVLNWILNFKDGSRLGGKVGLEVIGHCRFTIYDLRFDIHGTKTSHVRIYWEFWVWGWMLVCMVEKFMVCFVFYSDLKVHRGINLVLTFFQHFNLVMQTP